MAEERQQPTPAGRVVARIPRLKDEEFRVLVREVQGRPVIEIRLFVARWSPTAHGIVLPPSSIPSLRAALEAIERQTAVPPGEPPPAPRRAAPPAPQPSAPQPTATVQPRRAEARAPVTASPPSAIPPMEKAPRPSDRPPANAARPVPQPPPAAAPARPKVAPPQAAERPAPPPSPANQPPPPSRPPGPSPKPVAKPTAPPEPSKESPPSQTPVLVEATAGAGSPSPGSTLAPQPREARGPAGWQDTESRRRRRSPRFRPREHVGFRWGSWEGTLVSIGRWGCLVEGPPSMTPLLPIGMTSRVTFKYKDEEIIVPARPIRLRPRMRNGGAPPVLYVAFEYLSEAEGPLARLISMI